MDLKTRWSSQSRSGLLRGAGQAVEGEAAKPANRARVLRGNYTLEEASVLLGSEPVAMRTVTHSKLRTISDDRPDEVRIEYDPSRYGIMKVETVDEREQRHKAELETMRRELKAAQDKVKQARQQGHDEGLAVGIEQGRQQTIEELKAEHDARLTEIQRVLQSITEATSDYYQQVETELVRFALMIARKVVGDAAANHEQVATRLAKEALKQASERTSVTILCNPEDETELTEAGVDLKTVSEGIREIEVQPSQRVSRGSVILETNGGSIDATIETILNELHIALLEEEFPTSGDAS